MKLPIGILAMLLPVLCQGQAAGIRPLYIGDRLPAVICSNTINDNTSSIEFSAYKGKVIVLDFWATWCSSCVIHLPLMDSLQHLFKDKLQCILVSTATTGDTKEKVQSFLQKRAQAGHPLSLPVIISDTLLTRMFPHRLLPHYVWINTNGTVAAITDGDAFTAANINTLYNEKRIALTVKQDVLDYNEKQPLLQDGNGGSADKLISAGMLTHYINGLPTGTRINNDNGNRKVTFLNMPILALYQAALGFDGNRVLVITTDSLRYFKIGQRNAIWNKNFFCYENTLPAEIPKSTATSAMLCDLNNRLGLYGRIEMRTVPCYVLQKLRTTAVASQRETTGSEAPLIFLHNEPLSILMQQLNSQLVTAVNKPIFLDESGFTGNLNLTLSAGINDIPALKKQLQSYGFDLITAAREINMFVLSELNKP